MADTLVNMCLGISHPCQGGLLDGLSVWDFYKLRIRLLRLGWSFRKCRLSLEFLGFYRCMNNADR